MYYHNNTSHQVPTVTLTKLDTVDFLLNCHCIMLDMCQGEIFDNNLDIRKSSPQ